MFKDKRENYKQPILEIQNNNIYNETSAIKIKSKY